MGDSGSRQTFDVKVTAVSTFGEKSLKVRLQEHTVGTTGRYKVTWPMRHYKATAERVVPAKAANTIRLNTIQIKEIK